MKVIGWQLVRLVAEAQRDLVGGTVGQIRRSADRTRLAMLVDSASGKRHLILGVRTESAALFWTRTRDNIRDWETYERTEVFNRLRGARIEAVGIAKCDRVVRFEFLRPSAEDSDSRQFSLVAAWAGSFSNIWLVNPTDDRILERFHSDASGDSQTLALPTPPDLVDWMSIQFPDYRGIRQSDPDAPLADFLRQRFWGIDTGLARQISADARRAHSDTGSADLTASQRMWEEFQSLRHLCTTAINPETRLNLEESDQDPSDIRIANESALSTSSIAELLALCDSRQRGEDKGSLERARLAGQIETLIKKNDRRLASIERTLAESARAEEYKFLGDLLNANRQLIRKGLKTVSLEDWRTGKKVEVALNPARSTQQNIDDYYRKSRKASSAIDAARAERPHLLREQDRLNVALIRLGGVSDTSISAGEIAASLGIPFGGDVSDKRTQVPRLPYREFVIGKERLWVGRSSRDNDELTLRYARPQDIFFHVHGAAGSHVILKRDSKDAAIDKGLLTLTAQVAAYFSKAKHAGLVPVVYTEARYVRKPRKAPPGTVSIEREKTLMVRPIPPPGYHDR